jgi:hypothetical protein
MDNAQNLPTKFISYRFSRDYVSQGRRYMDMIGVGDSSIHNSIVESKRKPTLAFNTRLILIYSVALFGDTSGGTTREGGGLGGGGLSSPNF